MRPNTLCKKWLPSRKTTTDERNWQLDSLRALAVTGVLIHHAWPTCILDFVDLGHVGVRLFFVLSGYLITGILLRCRRSIEAGQSDVATALRRFYIRRFLRIFPPYYALLALMVMAMLISYQRAKAESLGVHGEVKPQHAFAKQGDRIEIYRALAMDPKEARRERAKRKRV